MRRLPWVVLFCVVGCGTPTPPDMTQGQLLRHLKLKGLNPYPNIQSQTVMWLIFARDEADAASVGTAVAAGAFPPGLVVCTKEATPQAAAAAAKKHGSAAFAWGKYWFRGHPVYSQSLKSIQNAVK